MCKHLPARDDIPANNTDPDESLVELAKAGDVHAFGFLVLQYKDKIFRTIFRITKNREDAEDQVQETFLRAYRGIREFRGNSKFSSWLTRIAVNQALLCLRKRRYTHVSLDHPISSNRESFKHDVQDWQPNPEQYHVHSEVTKNLSLKISRLPKAFRSVIVLRHLHEYTTEETAAELGISVAAFKGRIHRARQQLCNQIGDRPDFLKPEPYSKHSTIHQTKMARG